MRSLGLNTSRKKRYIIRSHVKGLSRESRTFVAFCMGAADYATGARINGQGKNQRNTLVSKYIVLGRRLSRRRYCPHGDSGHGERLSMATVSCDSFVLVKPLGHHKANPACPEKESNFCCVMHRCHLG